MWHDENGSPFFSAGPDGARYTFDPDEDDTVAVAFTKAVNDIVESGEEVEGGPAVAVAEVLKEAGQLAWPTGYGYNELRSEIETQLPRPTGHANDCSCCTSGYYVQDIALDARHALVCGYIDGGDETYVVPFDVHGSNSDYEVVVGDRSAWVEVEREFVTKAGRMFSARNLTAMQEARDALDKLIQAGHTAAPEADAEEAGEEGTTFKGVEMSYSVQKADADMRYTLGPLYAPMREDAHGEWIEDEALHKSVHEFVRDSADTGRRINLQHGEKGDIQVGEWVEVVRWPYESTIKMNNAKGEEYEVVMPEGTVYMGVVWDEEYWDVEKSRPKGIDGYSLGGRAVKIRGTSETLKDMGYKVAKAVEPEAIEPEPAPEPTPEPVEKDAAETEAALRLTKELAEARARDEQGSSVLDRVLKIFEKQAEHPPVAPVHHTHLPPNPDTVVNINDEPLEPDAPEGG